MTMSAQHSSVWTVSSAQQRNKSVSKSRREIDYLCRLWPSQERRVPGRYDASLPERNCKLNYQLKDVVQVRNELANNWLFIAFVTTTGYQKTVLFSVLIWILLCACWPSFQQGSVPSTVFFTNRTLVFFKLVGSFDICGVSNYVFSKTRDRLSPALIESRRLINTMCKVGHWWCM